MFLFLMGLLSCACFVAHNVIDELGTGSPDLVTELSQMYLSEYIIMMGSILT